MINLELFRASKPGFLGEQRENSIEGVRVHRRIRDVDGNPIRLQNHGGEDAYDRLGTEAMEVEFSKRVRGECGAQIWGRFLYPGAVLVLADIQLLEARAPS